MLSHFFYYCDGDHRDLHSFPTRRSSDLQRDVLLDERVLRLGQDAHEITLAERLELDANREPPLQLGDEIGRLRHVERAGRDERSEEHTSELQSRLHLVCRLLLEKKKIYN